MDIEQKALEAREASIRLSAVTTDVKNAALSEIARAIEHHKAQILAANRSDLEKARKESAAAPLLKRLKFDEAKIRENIQGLNSLINLPDPTGKTLSAMELDEGL